MKKTMFGMVVVVGLVGLVAFSGCKKEDAKADSATTELKVDADKTVNAASDTVNSAVKTADAEADKTAESVKKDVDTATE